MKSIYGLEGSSKLLVSGLTHKFHEVITSFSFAFEPNLADDHKFSGSKHPFMLAFICR